MTELFRTTRNNITMHIKNPISGRIEADEVGSVTYTEFAKAPKGACKINVRIKTIRGLRISFRSSDVPVTAVKIRMWKSADQ